MKSNGQSNGKVTSVRNEPSPLEAAEAGAGKRARILIVEDEPAMVAGLRDNFEFEGYDVISADNGVAGRARGGGGGPGPGGPAVEEGHIEGRGRGGGGGGGGDCGGGRVAD